MFNPRTELLVHFLAARAAEMEVEGTRAAAVEAARAALAAVPGAEPEIAAALASGEPAPLRALLAEWTAGKRPFPEHDRDLLKRAMRAFRKRLGVTQLDDESTMGGGAMSGGRASGIAGVSPPRDYPREIWLELARQGRLVNRGQGVFELGRGG